MAVINVSNSSQLSSVLSSASAGDTIVLSGGNYGDLTITKDFTSEVTIKAENPLGATFGAIKITGSNITLDGLDIDGRFTIQNATNVNLLNSNGSSWNEVLTSSNIVIEGNEFTNALNLDNVSSFRVADNYIHEVEGDLLRIIGGSSDGVVENNVLWDMIPLRYADGTTIHADALQMFSNSTGTPHDIIIRGNHIYDDPATGDGGNLWGQGIFLGGPTGGYRNITIEENLVDTASPNAIYISNGVEGNVIRNNTVLSSGTIQAKTGDSSGTIIYDNVAKRVITEDGAVAGDNYIYSDEGALFQNGGDGTTWQGFLPKPGSAIDFGSGYGALIRLNELETGVTSPVPSPSPAPDPSPSPSPTPEPSEPASSIEDAALSLSGSYEISSNNDVIEIAPTTALELETGTIALSFNTDAVGGTYGILSKDASYYAGGGNHFLAYIENGTLKVRFQDGTDDAYINVSGIKANTDYDLQISYGNGSATLWLNGTKVGETETAMSWADNTEYLQVGAIGWSSATGKAGFSDRFDGTISNVVIVDGKYNPAGLENLAENSSTYLHNLVYSLTGDTEFNRTKSDIVSTAHDPKLEISEGTVAFTFETDRIDFKKQGLISKDALEYTGGGNHFSSWINYDNLKVRFQNGAETATFVFKDVEIDTEYDVQAYFDGDVVGVIVNGVIVGERSFSTDWTTNEEYLQVGGLGWNSATGDGDVSHSFDGTLSDVMIFNSAIQQPLDFVLA